MATYQSPVNCTLAEDAKPSLPRAGPDVHSDVLLVLCGLQCDPLSIFEAVYGLHEGRLNVVVDLGTEAIKRGESVDSVVKHLMLVARSLAGLRPKSERANTRVLVPSLFLSKTGEDVVLSSWGKTDTDMSVQLRLHAFNSLLLSLNVRIGHLEGRKDQDSLVRWDNSLFSG